MAETYHEPYPQLSDAAHDMHRALQSVKEELDAVDWYLQRIDVTPDPELKAILIHNRDEEKEHAAMVLEWIRRHDPAFDEALRTYLFTEGDLVAIEERHERGESAAEGEAAPGRSAARLTVGSLR
ncbi:MAG: encapsulin-associated ferritin-like protein [Myxococcales bacterium]|jgi:ferritin-like protein